MHPSTNRRLIVVLGMHRSGTSTISRALQTMGVELGDRLMPPVAAINAKGFWEDLDINALNIEMLGALAGDWHRLAPITGSQVEVLERQGYFLRAVELLRAKVGNAPVFGFKDPRVARLLAFWKPVFAHCAYEVDYLLVCRHPLSVVKSLARRDRFAAEKSYLLWFEHVVESLAATRGQSCIVVDYDRMMQAPEAELARIARHLRLRIDPAGVRQFEIDFLDESLRHTVYAPADLELDATCPPAVREAYASLLRLATDQAHLKDAAVQGEVDGWRRELDRMHPALELLDDYDEQRSVISRTVAERDRQIAERDEEIARLLTVVAERDIALGQLAGSLASRDQEIDRMARAIAERDAHAERQLAVLAQRDQHIHVLGEAVMDRDSSIRSLKDSRSWKVTAPLRALSDLFSGRPADSAMPVAPPQAPSPNDGKRAGPEAFFTICSKNFLAHARVLHESLQPHYPDARFFVVLCDRVDGSFNPADEPFEFVYLEELDLPDLAAMAARYNITEFNTAVKPFAFLNLMQKRGFRSVVYLDPDLLFVDRMDELDQLLAGGAEAVLTPHLLQPAEGDELHDGKMLLFGIYNLGFLALRNTPSVVGFLSWWGRRLEHQCVIRLEEGLFVDQKWADLLPAFVPGTRVLHHPGYNVAYWNLPQRRVECIDGKWFANGQPLRFVHFSGNSIDDPTIFSRHSQQVTLANIGDMRQLLDYYRAQVKNQGHQFYRRLPYAFSWEGAAGVNLHTPKALDLAAPDADTPQPPATEQAAPVPTPKRWTWPRRIRIIGTALPAARGLSGGWIALTRRTWNAYRRNGLGYVKAKIVELSGLRAPPRIEDRPSGLGSETTGGRRLLYLDWAIPKPDNDAGSLHAVLLMRIAGSVGYGVTFLPCNLKYEERYFENLVDAGIRVICYPAIRSVDDWLRANAGKFDVCILSRGPVVWPYLETLKSVAPELRLIFNTVDLHYVRELRQAELEADAKLRAHALVTRRQELELVRRCDVTILLSDDELYTIRKEQPSASLAVVPLVLDEMPGATGSYGERRDILFLGSFAHKPNVDAVIYFIEEVLPLVLQRIPGIRFKVVGAKPPQSISKLAEKNACVDVLGFVQDLAPLFDGIRLSVAPLRFGAGIKGKIASSLGYGVPCVATPVAVEGMGLEPGRNILVGETPAKFADALCNAYLDEALWQRLSAESHQFAAERYSMAAVGERLGNLLSAVTNDWRPMESLVELVDGGSYQHHRGRLGDAYEARVLREQTLLPGDGSTSFRTPGYCSVCRRATEFLTSYMYSTGPAPDGRPMPNWREHMQCRHCGLVNRVRAALHALHTLAVPDSASRIYATEQVTSTYRWLRARYDHLIGSEYFGPDHAPGADIDGIRHEDVTRLSFGDASLDRILSLDVLEHVPDFEAALREFFRVLDGNGVLLFSVPFAHDHRTNVLRATLHPDGRIEHHLPAEYHGNPVDPEGGALCFRYFGWELLDQLRSIGFVRVRALAYWSETQGYLGAEQYLFLAHKPPA